MITLHAEQAGNEHPETDPEVVGSSSQDDAESAPALPDRANAPVSVVTERFLRAILTYVPLDRIVELHLFSPLRQGTTETGIAVIAADILEPEPTPEVEGAPLELSLTADATAVVDASEAIITLPSGDDAVTDSVVSSEESPDVAPDDVDNDDDDVNPYADEADDMVIQNAADSDPIAAGSVADDAVLLGTDDSVAPAVVPDVNAVAAAAAPVHVRHTVYTARYRLVIKGPDRGKWEIDVVNEADAPLLTVETVVRGVQRRAGEATDTVRYDAVQIARALRQLEPGTNG